MEVKLAKKRGFCFGVEHAIELAERLVRENGPGRVAALGPVIHNPQVVKRLEDAGVIASRRVGRTRLYSMNPRYPFRRELMALVEKAFTFVPEEEKDRYYRKRTRPRRAGKPQ